MLSSAAPASVAGPELFEDAEQRHGSGSSDTDSAASSLKGYCTSGALLGAGAVESTPTAGNTGTAGVSDRLGFSLDAAETNLDAGNGASAGARTGADAVTSLTPLSALSAKIFRSGLLGSSSEESLARVVDWLQLSHTVHQNAESAVAVLNDLLNYDKIESGTLSLDESVIPMWKFLKQTVKAFDIQAKQKDINLELDLEPYSASLTDDVRRFKLARLQLLGDEVRMAQVIRNLVSNALKFTPQNGTVTVKGTSTLYFLSVLLFRCHSIRWCFMLFTIPCIFCMGYLSLVLLLVGFFIGFISLDLYLLISGYYRHMD